MSPPLTDGTVTLVPFDAEHIAAHVAGEDDEARLWFGQPGPSTIEHMEGVVSRWRSERDAGTRLTFAVLVEGEPVGVVELRPHGEAGSLSWLLYAEDRHQGHATRAVRLLAEHAFRDLGIRRVEAQVDPRNTASQRVATRAGMQREGVRRVEPGMADRGDAHGMAIYARLASDPPLSEPGAFRALLNSFLPRKRAIGQMLIRDADGPETRVLLCQLTYKQDWDLPGGVVEVGESPREATAREVAEELGLSISSGPLLLTDWLPSWGGWDDALCLVFDGGVLPASIEGVIVKQAREIRDARFCTLAEVEERCADFTARRVAAALTALREGSTYTESGQPAP